MSIGSVVRKVASGGAQALSQGASGLQNAITGGQPAAYAPETLPPTATPQYTPMNLPAIDPNDPEAAHKQQIQDYIRQLEAIHMQAMNEQPDVNSAMQPLVNAQDTTPEQKVSPLAAFAIGLGSPQGLADVKAQNAGIDQKTQARKDYINSIREMAIKGNIQKLLDEGKFKETLAQTAALEGLHHQQKMEETAALVAGRNQVAKTNAESRLAAIQARIKAKADSLSLKGEFQKKFAQEAGKIMADAQAGIVPGADPSEVAMNFAHAQDEVDALATRIAGEQADSEKAPKSKAVASSSNPDEQVTIMRDGQKGTISRKYLRPTDKIVTQ